MIYFLFVTHRDRRSHNRIILFVLAGAVFAIVIFTLLSSLDVVHHMFAERSQLQSYDINADNRSRLNLEEDSFREMFNHPLGMGPWGFAHATNWVSHEVYIGTFLNHGWVGGFAFLTLIALTLSVGFRSIWIRTPWQPFVIATYVSFIAMTFEGVWGDIDHWRHFYVLLGLVWGLAAAAKRNGWMGTPGLSRREQSFKSGHAIVAAKLGSIAVISKLSHRPRSIVFLGTAHDNGGTSILAGNLARAMRTRGHHVEEWYLFGSDGDMPAGSRVFEPTKRSHSPLLLTALFFRVVATLRERKPDVLFGLQPYSNVLVGVAGRIAGIRDRVPTYHGPRAFVTPSLMALDNIVHWLGLYTQMVGCANSVVETYGRDDMAVVVNGHDIPQAFSRAEARAALGLPADGLLLGQIGRLSHQKNQSFSLELIRRMPEATLVLLGIGPDEAALKSQIGAAGLADRVHIVPAIAHGRIGLFYSAIDLVLFPSRYEGLSLAGIEAIHAGMPALCTDIRRFAKCSPPRRF